MSAEQQDKKTYDLTDPDVAQMAQAAPQTAPDHPLLAGLATATMLVEKDVRIPCSDGSYLVGDVFRPTAEGTYPVLLAVGPYGKDIPFEMHWPYEYARSGEQSPYMTIETVNPESWVADGYAVVHVDQAGTGKSPGVIDVFSSRDTGYFADAIGWAGSESWSNGKVGLIGISYYSLSQLAVAARRPEHLAAIIPWEVGHDLYRHFAFQGGILSNGFIDFWFQFWVLSNQYGRDLMDKAELAQSVVDFSAEMRRHPYLDEYWQERIADVTRIDVPLFTAGNWAGTGLTLRSHIDLFRRAASSRKWLRIHTGGHIEPFYEAESRREQKRFLDHFLKGTDNGQDELAPLHLAIRRGKNVTWRYEHEWPLARTVWDEYHLDAETMTADRTAPASDATASFPAADPTIGVPIASYNDVLSSDDQLAEDGSVTFTTAPFDSDVEITGPIALTLTVSATADDADLFVAIRDIAPDGTEIVVDGMDNPQTPVTFGWLRLSHRELDETRTTTGAPVHSHRGPAPLAPGVPVEVVVEVGPTSMIFEAGHRLAVQIGTHDLKGSFPLLHNDPSDRRVGGTLSVHTGPARRNALLLPRIPAAAT